MTSIIQYLTLKSSIKAVDRIIDAIDKSRDCPEIYYSVSNTMENLIKQKTELIGKISGFEKQYGIELRLNDPELANLTYVRHGHYIIFDAPTGEFIRVIGFDCRGWHVNLPRELEPYLENKKDSLGEFAVRDFNGKTVAACDNANAASAVIEMYLERKR